MTNQEFEKVYFDAREALYRRGKAVGRPIISKDGARRCPVDSVLLIDGDLLKEAWGEGLAGEILTDLAESDAILSRCAECERLWQAYSVATRRYLRVFADQQASGDDPAEMDRLTVILGEASQTRSRLRQAVREHGTAHRISAA